jgi:toxin ParE1/3/4
MDAGISTEASAKAMKIIVLTQAEESLNWFLHQLALTYERRYFKNLERLVRIKVRSLGSHPGAGQLVPELACINMGHRRLVVRNCKIVYRIMDDLIIVNDIFDSRKDHEGMKG